MTDRDARPTDPSPSQRMMQLIWPGAMAAQAVHAAAKLGLADRVRDGAKTIDELARATRTHPPSLGRLLRTLARLGVLIEDAGGKFQCTPMGEALRSGHPQSIRAWAIMPGAPFVWRPWGELCETIATGEPSFDHVFGAPFFEYLGSHPDDAAVFDAAMNAGASMIVGAFVAAYDFSPFERIADVGGGYGALLQGVLEATPKARGILFDLPDVVARATALRTGPVADRCEIVGGSFFETVPEADAYVLKGVIHDWSDADAVRILRSCRRGIRPGGRLLVIDNVLKPSNEPDPSGGLMDLMMAVLVKGRERTEPEFRTLLRDGGFTLSRVIPMAAPPSSILESEPA